MKRILLILVAFCAVSASGQTLSKLYKEVSSSVVVINTLNNLPSAPGQVEQVTEFGGLGSGVLISEDGLIWTASHVVHSADKLFVKFKDGDKYNAEVLSSSPVADVALIKIIGDFQLKDKHVSKIGDSDLMEIGQDIFVIGAPRGIEQTLSRGIVSGRIKPEDDLTDHFLKVEFIQTDASINPGNSGGPMYNMKGEVIGIASFILSESGGFDGIGFGASSNVAKKILLGRKKFWSGMEFVVITPELASVFNLPQSAGLLIVKVAEGGLGYKAGLRGGYIKASIEGKELLLGGDIILEVGGIKLDRPENFMKLTQLIGKFNSGESYVLKYLRDGEVKFEVIKVK
ncbi:trypsin-like peptidase domain-containing protein [Flavobacteriaceae bacterium]|nr:trypsin-like peptidase domain-containing protein [Flavobacteriaceae bacterium]